MSQRLATAMRAARTAGELLLKTRGSIRVQEKGHGNWVTTADREAERLIQEIIQSAYPEDSFFGEEESWARGETLRVLDQVWIVDPLDGTTNYVRGLDHFAVSIAFWAEDKPQVGVVYAPAKQELFVAEAGSGATANGRTIQVSKVDTLADSLLATGFAYKLDASGYRNGDHVANFLLKVQDLRRLGSAALDLAYVASGRFDGFWEYGLSPWDVAAGVLLVQEAGGSVTDFRGNPVDIRLPSIVATNSQIHQEVLSVLAMGKTGM